MAGVRFPSSCLILAILLATLAGAAVAHADWVITDTQEYTYPAALPSFTGDIIVEATGSLSLTGYELTLPGSVIVPGDLALNDCTLRFTPSLDGEQEFSIYGGLDATDSTLTSATGKLVYLHTWGSSVNTLTGCTLDYVRPHFRDSSRNSITACTFSNACWWARFMDDSYNEITGSGFDDHTEVVFQDRSESIVSDSVLGTYGWAADSTRNTFAGCTFYDFEFHPPSVNALTDCTFSRNLVIFATAGTTMELVGLLPGQPVAASITTPGPFLSLANTTVAAYGAQAHGDARLTIRYSELFGVFCSDESQTTLENSHTQYFHIWTATHHFLGRGGVHCPYQGNAVNVAVDGYHEVTPQTTSITSNNSSFRVDFQNSSVGTTYLELGDNGDSIGSDNVVARSSLYEAVSCDHSSLRAEASTLRGGIGGWYVSDDANARFTAQNSTLLGLFLDGPATRVTLSDSNLVGQVEVMSWWALYNQDAVCTPELVFEGLTTLGYGGDPRVAVREGVDGARIIGDAQVTPLWHASEWAPGSTIVRTYSVQVVDRSRSPLPDVPVHVYDPIGTLIWQGVTDISGCAQAEITFDDTNYASEFRVKAWAEGGVDSAPVHFLSSTPLTLCPGAHPLSYASFEEERYPWTTFASSSDASTWRQLAGAEIPGGGTAPAAHSGDYEMLCDAADGGITGLRLDLPVTPSWPAEVTLRAWVYPLARSGGASSVIGFQTDLSGMLGYEAISDTEGALHLGGSTVSAPGLTTGRWHVVAVNYDCVGHRLAVSLDGTAVPEQATLPTLGAPAYALLGAGGGGGGAVQVTCFDDVNVVLGTAPTDLPEHPYAGLSGPEKIVEGRPMPYTVWLGNGYPVLGGAPAPGEQGAETMTLRLALPEYLEFLSSTPAPTRYEGDDPVWEVVRPYLGQEQYLLLTAQVPTGVTSGVIGPLEVYRDGGGSPEDALPQYVLTHESMRPDLWVRKEGPAVTCPGETVNYVITAGNSGYLPAEDILITDIMPTQLGGRTGIVANLVSLEPGETWRAPLSLVVGTTTPSGAVLTNWGAIESAAAEVSLLNNLDSCDTLVQPTPDPNQINVEVNPTGSGTNRIMAPVGGVERGDLLRYTIDCENPSGSTAYGVYARALLDPRLDDNTLSLPSGMSYDPLSRTLFWEIGTVPGHGTRSAAFTVQVPEDARRARSIAAQATLYFPSLSLERPTNITVSVVNGSFRDIPWNHWALLHAELSYENGIVGGYSDGSYRPALTVDRGQMAVFIARAIAGGEALVGDPPATASFNDVPTTHWAFKYIEYAKAHGVVGGYADGTYRPTLGVDRGQMAVFVARAVAGGDGAVPPAPGAPTFTDVAPGTPWAWAQKYVEYIVSRGVVAGYADGTYRPALAVTRDQMAVFVARAFALPM
jgi:uncharacterized repeat protein (TIGR01451 family)